MDEDDDAFLYGDGGEAGVKETGKAPNGASQVATAKQEAEKKADVDQGGEEDNDDDDDEEEEEDEEDSDSDLEIVIDSNAADASRPPPGYNQRPLQTFNKTLQAQQQQRTQQQTGAISSEYTPLTRPGQQNADGAESKPLVTQTSMTAAQAYALQQQQQLAQLPEGPPPPAPSTAPRLDLDPNDQTLMLPPDTVGGDPGPLIYHVDPTEMEEKPWRRPGADITDWFNYGFNEESWHVWGAKKTSINAERYKLEREGATAPHGDSALQQQQQQHLDNSLPMQFMQAMMAASGMSMPPDQMLSFMGLNSGGSLAIGGPMMGGMMPFMGGGVGAGGNGGMGPLMRMGQSQPAINGQGTYGGDHEPGQPSMHPNASVATAAERSKSPLPPNAPTGPKNANVKRYNDRDTGVGQADALDYGANAAAAAAAAAADGRDREDEHRRRRSSSAHEPRYSPAPPSNYGRSGGWDADSPRRSGSTTRRSQSPPTRGGQAREKGDRSGSRRYGRGGSVADSREGSLTPRASRHHHDDDERYENDDGRRRRTTSNATGASKRSSRRRDEEDAASSVAAGGGTGGTEDDSRSSSRRGQARSERRAGKEEEEHKASTTSTRRSRKRTADEDSELARSPPRESRRRR